MEISGDTIMEEEIKHIAITRDHYIDFSVCKHITIPDAREVNPQEFFDEYDTDDMTIRCEKCKKTFSITRGI